MTLTYLFLPYGRQEKPFRDTTSGLTITRWPTTKQRASLLKIITVVLLIDEINTSNKKAAREWERCVIVIVDYHLLSRLIDQFSIDGDWPSSASIFLIFSWEIYTYITFLFHVTIRRKKNVRNTSYRGTHHCILVQFKVIDENTS